MHRQKQNDAQPVLSNVALMRISSDDFRLRLLPILCAQGLGLACGVIGVRLVSQYVAPADYGAYAVFMTLATVGGGVIYAGPLKFLARHWLAATNRPALLREIAGAILRKAPRLAVAAAAATLLVAPDRPVEYGILLAAAAFALTLALLGQAALQAAREHWRDLGVAAGMSVGRSFAPPLLYVATGAGLYALMGGFLLHAIGGALLGAIALRRWWPRADSLATQPTLTAVYDSPQFAVLAMAGWLLAGLNRWIMAWFFGVEPAGYFTLAANLGAILPSVAGMVLLQYEQPLWFATPADSETERRALLSRVDRIAAGYTLAAFSLAAVVHTAMPWLTGTLVHARYATATGFVFMAGCFAAAVIVALYYHTLLLAARCERSCAVTDLSGAAVLIAGGLLSAATGLAWFKAWLVVSPSVPWLVNRTLARHALLAPPGPHRT